MRFHESWPDEGEVQWLAYLDRPDGGLASEKLMSAKAGDGSTWGDLPLVELVRTGDHGESLAPVPMPWLGSYTVAFQGEAIERARPVISPHADLRNLPTLDGTPIVVVVPPWVDGMLDETNSEVVRFPSSGRIMQIRRLALSPEAEKFGVIRLLEDWRGPTYFRADVVSALRDANVEVGTHFRAVN